MEETGGLPSMGSHRVRNDWSDLAAAVAAAAAWKDTCGRIFIIVLFIGEKKINSHSFERDKLNKLQCIHTVKPFIKK